MLPDGLLSLGDTACEVARRTCRTYERGEGIEGKGGEVILL